jgi:hypothetical protein
MVTIGVRAGLRFAGALLIVVFTAGLAGCGGGSVHKPFNPMDAAQPIRPTTIAVVSGSRKDGDVKLAEFVTAQLVERTTLRVLSQEEIGKRVPGYPSSIGLKKDDDIKEDDEKVIWFAPSEKAKLDALQARLKVDHLFVLWVPYMTLYTDGRGGSTYFVYPAGNMLAYPGGKVVASTRMVMGSSISVLALFRPKDYYIIDAIKLSAEAIVDDVITVTKSKK